MTREDLVLYTPSEMYQDYIETGKDYYEATQVDALVEELEQRIKELEARR